MSKNEQDLIEGFRVESDYVTLIKKGPCDAAHRELHFAPGALDKRIQTFELNGGKADISRQALKAYTEKARPGTLIPM